MSRTILAGSTDQSTIVRILDSSDGTPETGVTSATAGLAFNYRREEGTLTSIESLSDLSGLDDAHADGGLLHIGDGYYRLDIPDAAFAVGVAGVLITGTADGMVVIGAEHQIVGSDPAAARFDPASDTVDGVTYEKAIELLMAVLFGEATPSGSAVAFKKRDGTTTVTVTYGSTDGERTGSVIA